jgi:hypothetical protein
MLSMLMPDQQSEKMLLTKHARNAIRPQTLAIRVMPLEQANTLASLKRQPQRAVETLTLRRTLKKPVRQLMRRLPNRTNNLNTCSEAPGLKCSGVFFVFALE